MTPNLQRFTKKNIKLPLTEFDRIIQTGYLLRLTGIEVMARIKLAEAALHTPGELICLTILYQIAISRGLIL